ncbi:MAG TPA: hypothetical protein VFU62_08735 [Hanamia sp.]|nr:hypothetical protein [Hanamia sp.]
MHYYVYVLLFEKNNQFNFNISFQLSICIGWPIDIAMPSQILQRYAAF